MSKTSKSPPTFIQKSKAVQTRIEASEYKGMNLVNIRDWVKRASDTEYRPTPKGMTVQLEHWKEFQALVANFVPDFDSGSKESVQMYAIFDGGEKELPEKELKKAFQHCIDQDLALTSLSKTRPTKGKVVYAAKVSGKKVDRVKRYAKCEKVDGDRVWKKL